MVFSKKLKVTDIIKNLLFFIIILLCLVVLLLKVNKYCNNCIVKDPEKILNAQGYLFDVKNTEVKDFDPKDEHYDKPKHTKAHFNPAKTTGFMTSTENYEFENPRKCS